MQATKIKRDLERRKVKNLEQMKAKRAIERCVLDLDIDWKAFHHRLSKTLDSNDGQFLNCGTWLGPPPERDVEYAVPTAKLKACKTALKAAGFRFETAVVVH